METIDIHAHFYPESLLRLIESDGAPFGVTCSYSDPALAYLIGLVGADRVMLGSDFCFDMSYERPVEVVTGHVGLSDADRDLILGGNARRLLVPAAEG